MTKRSILAAAFVITGCTVDDLDTPTTDQALIHEEPGFAWYPPMVDAVPPTPPGAVIDTGLADRLAVEIADVDCGNAGLVGAVVHTFSVSPPEVAKYKVTFTDSAAIGLVSGQCYRVIVRLDGNELGYRDMFAHAGPQQPPEGYKKWSFGPGPKIIAFALYDFDSDGDGVSQLEDNCPAVANADQADGDGDGVGSACDNCPDAANPGQEDFDLDGTGDACETGCVAMPGQILAFTGDGTTDSQVGPDATWTGTAAYAPAVLDRGFALDGSSNLVTGTLPYDGAFTVQLWATASEIRPDKSGLLASGLEAQKDRTFQIDWNNAGGYRFTAGTAFNRNFGAASTTGFQHLVVTRDGAQVRLYRDGVEVASGSYAGLLQFDRFVIGANRGGSARHAGVIDEVRVWNRALSAAEVATVYGAGQPVCVP